MYKKFTAKIHEHRKIYDKVNIEWNHFPVTQINSEIKDSGPMCIPYFQSQIFLNFFEMNTRNTKNVTQLSK